MEGYIKVSLALYWGSPHFGKLPNRHANDGVHIMRQKAVGINSFVARVSAHGNGRQYGRQLAKAYDGVASVCVCCSCIAGVIHHSQFSVRATTTNGTNDVKDEGPSCAKVCKLSRRVVFQFLYRV